MPGPLPKRSAERRRRNAVPGETTIPMQGRVRIPACPARIHPVARRWYNALRRSGQAELFEPSDWAAALYVCEAMTKNLEAPRFSAQLFTAVFAAMDAMLTTETARRKARVEVERALSGGDEEEEGSPTKMDDYRERLAR